MHDIELVSETPMSIYRYSNWLQGNNTFSMTSSNVSITNSRQTLVWLVKQNSLEIGVVVIEVSEDNYAYFRIGINPEVRRKGLGYAVTQKVLELPNIKDYRSLRAIINPINTAGIKIMKKFGFRSMGTNDEGNNLYELRDI